MESAYKSWETAPVAKKTQFAAQIYNIAVRLETRLKQIEGPSRDYYLATILTIKDVAVRAFHGQSFRTDREVFLSECVRLKRYSER